MASQQAAHSGRYGGVSADKAHGITYTPKLLADFVARQIVDAAAPFAPGVPLRVFDPAVGAGELLVSLVEHLAAAQRSVLDVSGFETDGNARTAAVRRLSTRFPGTALNIEHGNFLDFVQDRFGPKTDLFGLAHERPYDLVIANPPYVRTQVMGARQAQRLSAAFGLSGRVDLYHAFMLALSRVLSPDGVLAIIVSNRFMTTRSGTAVRKALLGGLDLIHAWDLGDTKLFDAAVLPAIVLARGCRNSKATARFTSIYQTTAPARAEATNPVAALERDGVVALPDGRRFEVRHGRLNTGEGKGGVWRIGTRAIDAWLAAVDRHQWCTFRDVGRVRVGVKTCADRVFIRDDWDTISTGLPELLRPLTTHHVGQRFMPRTTHRRQILYPHENVGGSRRAVDLDRYPRSRAYLESHRRTLERRRYVLDAGRGWYELWVPQDPGAWSAPKLVFRDIAEKPTFWVDVDGSVVNGDCYWFTCNGQQNAGNHPEGDDLLWLAAAVANSTFAERFYDYRFNNKLYAGRRRYLTQYVEQFPLPDPSASASSAIIEMAKAAGTGKESPVPKAIEDELDSMVWTAFGLRR